jgi:hypothetical protein
MAKSAPGAAARVLRSSGKIRTGPGTLRLAPTKTLAAPAMSTVPRVDALLVAPVAYHRLVFRQHQKDRLIKDANVMALAGLAAVALAISGAVLLVVSYVDTGWPVVVISVFVVCLFGGLWFALPLVRRRSRSPQ